MNTTVAYIGLSAYLVIHMNVIWFYTRDVIRPESRTGSSRRIMLDLKRSYPLITEFQIKIGLSL